MPYILEIRLLYSTSIAFLVAFLPGHTKESGLEGLFFIVKLWTDNLITVQKNKHLSEIMGSNYFLNLKFFLLQLVWSSSFHCFLVFIPLLLYPHLTQPWRKGAGGRQSLPCPLLIAVTFIQLRTGWAKFNQWQVTTIGKTLSLIPCSPRDQNTASTSLQMPTDEYNSIENMEQA